MIQEQLVRGNGGAKDWDGALQLGALTHLAYDVRKKHSAAPWLILREADLGQGAQHSTWESAWELATASGSRRLSWARRQSLATLRCCQAYAIYSLRIPHAPNVAFSVLVCDSKSLLSL